MPLCIGEGSIDIITMAMSAIESHSVLNVAPGFLRKLKVLQAVLPSCRAFIALI